jgi:hypothetical protein
MVTVVLSRVVLVTVPSGVQACSCEASELELVGRQRGQRRRLQKPSRRSWCLGADLAQSRALRPQHDRLLAVPLDIEKGMDVEHRPVGGSVLPGQHLLHDDRDRVRQLVAHLLQRCLADQLGDHDLFRLVGELTCGIERR